MLSGADIRGDDDKDSPGESVVPSASAACPRPGPPWQQSARAVTFWAVHLVACWSWSPGGRGQSGPSSSVRHPAWGPALTDAPWMFAADGCQVERNPMCFVPLSSLQPGCCSSLPEVGASEQVRSTEMKAAARPGPSLLPSGGEAPLCHWPSARAAVEGPTAGAQGRLAHMAVFFSLELPAGSPSKTSSTIPTAPAPAPASCATRFSPPHSFPPKRVLRGARASAGCSEQCVLRFPPRGERGEPAWESLGARRSEDKSKALQGQEQSYSIWDTRFRGSITQAHLPCDHGVLVDPGLEVFVLLLENLDLLFQDNVLFCL